MSTLKPPTETSRIGMVERYFETHADYWSNAYLKPGSVGDLVLRDRKDLALQFALSELTLGARILDAGCGAGLATLALLQHGFEVDAFDISLNMVDLCKANIASAEIEAKRYRVQRGDVFAAGLPAASYDAIVALGFLQYQADEIMALSQMADLLKPGGILIVSGPTKVKLSEYFGLAKFYYKGRDLFRRSEPHPELEILTAISTHYYSPGRFRTILNSAGFKMLAWRGHGFINFAILRDLTTRGQHFIYRFFGRLAKVLPIGRFGNDLVVLARKQGEA